VGKSPEVVAFEEGLRELRLERPICVNGVTAGIHVLVIQVMKGDG
jgi:hypothetical protein